ncbi:MAG: DNA replication/repair protein RecF [Chloroflexi bacterium]|nr:DNA replication/repair protein RecF [Chloroflexota bacterium]
MYIEHLSVRNFRNYMRLDIDISPGATLFYGPNAAGKTSILEAVYVLAMSRSPRTHTDRELIYWQAEQSAEIPQTARISGKVRRTHGTTTLDVIVQARGTATDPGSAGGTATKVLRVDHKPVKASGLLGFLRVVFFAPTDLELLTGAPSERRRWLDAMLSQLDYSYLHALNNYQKVLLQRNSLLRKWREQRRVPRNHATELAFWDEELATHATHIMHQRRHACAELTTLAQPMYHAIAQTTHTLTIRYIPNIEIAHDADIHPHDMLTHFQRHHADDIARGQTTCGPHRDDVCVIDHTIDLGAFGSRGQQRSGVMALKLAEVAFMQQRTGELPVLLLDDVLSELDIHRRHHLLACIAHPHQQTILTATGVDDFDATFLRHARLVRVDNGHVFMLE